VEEEDIGGGCSQEANRCRCADESAQMATTLGNMTFLHQRFGSKRREGNSFGATFTSSGTSGWLMDTLRVSPRVLRELAGGGSGVRLLDGFVAFPFSSGFTL
jgi:hypothetical protein